MEPQRITSATNPRIKEVVKLHNAKERKLHRLCIVEGARTITTAIQSLALKELFCTKVRLTEAQALAPTDKITILTDSLMNKISPSTTPSGLLGILNIPPAPSPDRLSRGIVLAQIADPGNMGTLIRTAAACSISSVVVVEGSDLWSPKVLQASVGTHTYVDLFEWSWDELITHKKELKLYALVTKEGNTLSTIDADRALIVVGSEAHGLPEQWVEQCDETITLPMPGSAESLNAAVAGSIALYTVFVQTGK